MARGAAVLNRRRAAREVALVVGCVVAAEWGVLPLFGRSAAAFAVPVCAAFAVMLASHRPLSAARHPPAPAERLLDLRGEKALL